MNELKFTEKEKNLNYLTRAEAAEYLKISVATIDRAVKNKTLNCAWIGRRVVFSRSQLDDFFNLNATISVGR